MVADKVRLFSTHLTVCGLVIILAGEVSAMYLPNRMKLRRELTSQREQVRRLQLQSMYGSSGKLDYDLTAAALLDKDFRKRNAEQDISLSSLSKQERLDQFFSLQEHSEEGSKQRKRSTDGEESSSKEEGTSVEGKSRIFVPFAGNSNANDKSKTPCRQKRSLEDGIEMIRGKRHLKTPPGQGLVPQYNMYDELCENNQPVKIVKIKSLVIKDGVKKENDISETLL